MKNLGLLLSFFTITVLWSCGNESTKSSGGESPVAETPAETPAEEASVEEQPAVCLWENLSVRQDPSSKGKWLTSMSLGEVVTYAGETALDSAADKSYHKVRLSDGTEGWSLATFIEIDGTEGVFKADTEIYKRPDLLTKANKQYSSMDIVAISNTNGGWVEVRGKRADGKYIESGWVKGDNISSEAVDVATAKFGVTALAKESMDEKIAALTEILENSDLASSAFIPALNEKLTELTDEQQALVPDVVEVVADSVQ